MHETAAIETTVYLLEDAGDLTSCTKYLSRLSHLSPGLSSGRAKLYEPLDASNENTV